MGYYEPMCGDISPSPPTAFTEVGFCKGTKKRNNFEVKTCQTEVFFRSVPLLCFNPLFVCYKKRFVSCVFWRFYLLSRRKDLCFLRIFLLQDLAEENNFKVIDEYEFNNYIPKYIGQMEKIVSATYEITRGKCIGVIQIF